MPQPLAQQPTNIQKDPSDMNQTIKRPGTTSANHDSKLKKVQSPAKRPSTSPETVPLQQRQPSAPQSQMKKITRRSSKPILNWFQRKLAGTVRARRASDPNATRSDRRDSRSPIPKDSHRRSSGPPQTAPVPVPARQRSNRASRRVPSTIGSTKRNTVISLNDDDINSVVDARTLDSFDVPRRTSSLLESTWSPRSIEEADEDASVRPIPPSAPPSPSPSRSSSSYLSDPRTFASMAASTKPTTLLSVDLTGGMAHIAQAPPTPTIPNYRITHHVRTHSSGPSIGGSITFSALPITTATSRPSSTTQGNITSNSRSLSIPLQAPQHTTHHPRNNPRPSSPPMDDASVLTLASSAFGMPGARYGAGAFAISGRTSLAEDSVSHYSNPTGLGDSASHFILNDVDGDGDDGGLLMEGERYGYGDVDASVRALRPRSSRRGSWESEASGWSARLAGVSIAPGTPSAFRDRSLWTNGSYRTGARSVDVGDVGDEDESASDDGSSVGEDVQAQGPGIEASSLGSVITDRTNSNSITESTPATGDDMSTTAPRTQAGSTEGDGQTTPPTSSPNLGSSTPKEKSQETPKGTAITLEDLPPLPPSPAQHTEVGSASNALHLNVPQDDKAETFSLATSDNHTDTFVSAPSTPMDW